MPHDPYKALYMHIPFCVKRCGYCDFATAAVPRDDVRIDEYVEQLVLDIRKQAKAGELTAIDTVYIGGGTPTHIGAARLSSLLYALSVSMDLTRDDLEFTVEANPESLDGRLVKDMWALGVNRISIGVQSFDDDVLRILGRAHDAARAKEAIREAKERFENISVDLMCGIPGQSAETFEASVEEAVALGVKHVSVYPLAIEPHTMFDKLVLAGEMDEPDDDVEAEHMEIAERVLAAHGFARYEVASYALPGYESKHNSSYWTGIPYLGIGASATTMTQNDERRMRVMNGEVVDDLNRNQMEAEDLMLGMRMACGISDERLAKACNFIPEARNSMESLVEEGFVERVENRWRPTRQGWLCGNELYGRLLDIAP
ncbi:MAG: radical SAM family heme chaperone HemW [Eggerthellaceae bacterium]|nr:radical SAM family heme chaperone HemW [Eggerthellaceae bacterium]